MQVRATAGTNGGTCLIDRHRPGQRPFFRFQCHRGHVWDADAEKVIGGAWCPRCKRVERHFSEVKESVEKRNGKVLSEFRNSRTPIEIECDRGHRWKASSTAILRGGWCRKCHFAARSCTLEDMIALAKKRGGLCLSSEYRNNRVKLRWQCSAGHEWMAKPNSVQQGGWCPKCAGTAKSSLEEMQKLAWSRNGVCLSLRYENQTSKLTWMCEKKHVWRAVPSNVKSGAWCRICSLDPKRFTIEDCNKIAARNGGKCLASEYKNSRIRMPWECAKGHVWYAIAKQVSRGSWCRQCANDARRKPKITVKTLQAYARKRGGRLVSDAYQNESEYLQWECANGHQWAGTWANIRNKGRWCPHCQMESKVQAAIKSGRRKRTERFIELYL